MILVTGGTGLLGSHLLLHLIENGEEVRSLYRSKPQIEKTKNLFILYDKLELFEKIHWEYGDILDISSLEIAFEGIEYVFHCAGFISFEPKDEKKLRKINIEGTANIVNFCIDKKIKKICHVSSIATLGRLKQNESYIDESSEWNPEIDHSDYAISKYGAEMEAWRGYQEGIQTIIINPGIILGPGFWNQGSNEIFKKIYKGIPFYTEGSTGYISVNDVVKTMYLLLKSEINGEKFIVISENISFQNIIQSISQKLNVKTPRIKAKKWMTSIAWRGDWLFSKLTNKSRLITKYNAISLHKNEPISNEKIKNALNFEFQSIEETIKETLVYFHK